MENKCKEYLKVLENDPVNQYYEAALNVMNPKGSLDNMFNHEKSVVWQVTALAVAPVLISYVTWILNDCIKRNITRLYFLARDGFVLREIAERICNKNGWDIKCNYLYCSRLALLLPFFYTNKAEAIEKLFSKGYRVSADIVFSRVGLSLTEKKELVAALELQNTHAFLTENGLHDLRKLLTSTPAFMQIIERNSKRAFDELTQYFNQEGLFDKENWALVDLGWTGSTQKILSQIMEKHLSRSAHLQGYYFGMVYTGDQKCGLFRTFYFSNYSLSKRADFNTDLFECLCTADHGMTVGYRNVNGTIEPILNKYTNSWLILLQNECIIAYAEQLLNSNLYDHRMILKRNTIHALLKNLMITPTAEEATIYGSILFSDDPTNMLKQPLSIHISLHDLYSYSFIHKIPRLLFGRKIKNNEETSWIYGTLSLYYPQKRLSRCMIRLTDYVRIFVIWLKGCCNR